MHLFVQDLSPGLDKLYPRSMKCVFVGYYRTQKGYRCYNPSTRKFLVSADVAFFESVPYFSTHVPLTVSETVPLSLSVPLLISASTVFLPISPAETKDLPASKPVQDFRYVYTHRLKVLASEPIPAILSPVNGPTPPTSASLFDLDVPIALQKGKQSCTDHPIFNFVSYDNLNPTFRQFALSLSSESIPRSYTEALLVPVWKQAMDEEMEALAFRGTWELVSAPTDAVIIVCRWVFTLKYRLNGSVDRYKSRLVAKEYTQTYGIDYFETFSPVARMNSIRILFSITVNLS